MNNLKQPRWKKVEYPRSRIIKAGKTIKDNKATSYEKEEALKVIDNWRAAHAYPLQVIYMHLRRMVPSGSSIIVAQRLKRLKSIIEKLEREPSMSLWTMQDLGGCRFIVDSVEEVYKYYEKYKKSRIRHKYIKTYDYIKQPKESGYRSLHVVYEFYSDKNEDYNKNMLIEIQFRTHLQHLWATAVETMGLFTNVAIKSGCGSEDVKRFFVLISSLFAFQEEQPLVPNTSNWMDEVIKEIKEIDEKNKFLDLLTGIRVATKFEEKKPRKAKEGYCILKLDYHNNSDKKLSIASYSISDFEQANDIYNHLEKLNDKKYSDIVMVRVSSFSSLRAAYPNYFTDISEFVVTVKKYIKRYEEIIS